MKHERNKTKVRNTRYMPHTEKTDAELVTLALEKPDYFALLVDRYEQKLKRFIHRISNVSHEEAEDLLQDVFLKVYTNLRDFDNKLSFSSWIYRITRNHVISAFRKKKARPQTTSWDADDTILRHVKDDLDLSIEFDKNAEKEKLIQCINTLDQKYRDILMLKYLEEKSYVEIGDIMKIPSGTIATRINRAKKLLKKQLHKKK